MRSTAERLREEPPENPYRAPAELPALWAELVEEETERPRRGGAGRVLGTLALCIAALVVYWAAMCALGEWLESW